MLTPPESISNISHQAELVPGEEFVKEEKKPACFGWTCWIFMCLAVAVVAVVAALIQADMEQRQRAREHLAFAELMYQKREPRENILNHIAQALGELDKLGSSPLCHFSDCEENDVRLRLLTTRARAFALAPVEYNRALEAIDEALRYLGLPILPLECKCSPGRPFPTGIWTAWPTVSCRWPRFAKRNGPN